MLGAPTVGLVIAAGLAVWQVAFPDNGTANLERPPTISESEITTPPPPPPTVEPTSAAGVPGVPWQVIYSVTGTKAPGDIITVAFVDESGSRRTQQDVIIPWSLTLTIPESVLSVEASSQSGVSKLNCSITDSYGTVLARKDSNAPQTSC